MERIYEHKTNRYKEGEVRGKAKWKEEDSLSDATDEILKKRER